MYIILEGSDNGEHYPFVRDCSRERLENELAQEISKEGIIHKYLSVIPDSGIMIGERVIIKGEIVVPKVVEVAKMIVIP